MESYYMFLSCLIYIHFMTGDLYVESTVCSERGDPLFPIVPFKVHICYLMGLGNPKPIIILNL